MVAVIFALLLPTPGHAQPAPLTGLDAWIESAMRDWEIPGFAIAVVRNDSVIYARGFGVRQQGTPGQVDEHTLFAIASTTKAMTVAGLGMLVDEGRLDWDDPVAKYMPGFQLADPWITRELTVRDLLTHRSGVSRSDNLWVASPFDRDEILRRARYLQPTAGFRSTYGYQNIMYIAAGELLGSVSGRGWDDFLAERLFRPLGMTRSTTRTADVESRDNVAASHIRVDGTVTAVPRRNYDNIGGAGAVFSSVHDMAQWLRMLLSGGEYEGRRVLADSTLQEMFTPQTLIRSDTTARRLFPTTNFGAYGLGWRLQDYHGRMLVHHSGSINWTRTHVGFSPADNIGVVAIANLNSSNLQQAAMYRVIDALLGVPPTDWSAEYLAISRRSGGGGSNAEENRAQGTTPSLPVDGYAGRYASDVYGDLTIDVVNSGLVMRYTDDYMADLEHWHHDTFRARWRRTGFGTAFITFAFDHQGRVTGAELAGFGTFRKAR